MAVRISGPQFYAWDDDGNPLAGGKLYAYESGSSSTLKDTFTGEDGATANANPVILNAAGYASVYLDGSYNLVLLDANDAEVWSKDPVSSVASEEWQNCTAATYVSTTSFTVSGNKTDIFTAGRSVRLYDGATYSYALIDSSSYSNPLTTVVVQSAVVVVGLTQACASIVTANSFIGRATEFVSVADMVAADLSEGDIASTQSYYLFSGSAAAQGGANYQIVTPAQFTTITGISTADGYGDHVLTNGNVAMIAEETLTPSQFGVTDAVSDQSVRLNALLARGKKVEADYGAVYWVNDKISFQSGFVDFKGATIKCMTTFPNTKPITEVVAPNVTAHNLIVDGNRFNVAASFTDGATGCGVLVGTNGDTARFKGCTFKECKTNGILVYGDGVEDVAFDDCLTENNAFIGYGVEITTIGAANPKNVRFTNITSKLNILGGFRAAGCDDLFLSNCIGLSEGNKAATFYIGDAKGGLRRAKVVNCIFGTANNSVNTIEIDGQVRTGTLTGQREVCDVEFVNVEAIGAGTGGTSIRVLAGASLRGSNIKGSAASIGFYPDTDSTYDVSRITMTTMSSRSFILDSKGYIDGLLAEFWSASQPAILIGALGGDCVIRKADLGALVGETGQHGVSVSGSPDNVMLDIRSFTGSGNLLNITSARQATWDIYNRTHHTFIRLEDGIAAPAATVGTAKMFIDASDGDLKIIFGDGVIKTIVIDT